MQKIILFVLFAFSYFYLNAQEYKIIENKALTPLLNPLLKDRKTLKLELSNGLKVYLISDPGAEQSSAALVVETGSWEEPDEHLGLAHFLEHMLFLGTSKYPDEGEYSRFIGQNGGESNAFTSNDMTAYMFSVNHNSFKEALDRFASFFKEPLFNPSGVSRELNAIDQEFAKNIENDDFRMFYVLKTLARQDHPESRFNIGNSISLANTTPNHLREWFKKHYSANIMRLAVYSSLPIETLKDIVVETFKDIPNNQRAPLSINIPITPEDNGKQIIFVEPIQNVRKLDILWELPRDFARMDESHPDSVLCHILGHEGKSSLIAQLKRENLATGIGCGTLSESRDHDFVVLEIQLTQEGIKNYDLIIERVYQTLAFLKEHGIPPEIFKEVQKQSLLEYQFQERRSGFKEAMFHATRLSKEDLATYPERDALIAKYDAQNFARLFKILTPRNARILIMAPYQDTRVKATEKEKWLGVSYSIKKIPQKLISQWTNATPHPEIKFPEANPYFPDNLNLLHSDALSEESVIPPNKGIPKITTLVDTSNGRIYYAQDKLYHVPKVDFIFNVRSPQVTPQNPQSLVLSEIYTMCVQDAVDDISYNAQLAGLRFSIKPSDNWNGVRLQIKGYSDKALKFFEMILGNLTSPSCEEAKFNRFKDKLLRSYADKALEMPVEQAFDDLKELIYKNYATSVEKETALKNSTYDDYLNFVKGLYQSNYIEGLIYGNISEQSSIEIVEKLQSTFVGNPYPPAKQFKKEILILNETLPLHFFEKKIDVQGNAALLLIETGEATYERRAAQQILMQAIQDAFFNSLRTQQQTGYIVFSAGEEMIGQLLNFFGVQSNTHDTRDLLARFELFIESYLKEIETIEIPSVRFNIIKNALIEQMRQPPKNLDEMADLIFELAFTYFGAFDRPQKRIEAFEKLQYPDFIEYAKVSLGRANKRRLGILLNGIFPGNNLFKYMRIRDKEALKESGHYLSNP